MFGFPEVETHSEDGSQERFGIRKQIHKEKGLSQIRHHFWWMVHNCVAHMLIGLFPIKPFFDFHDWTSHKIMAADD